MFSRRSYGTGKFTPEQSRKDDSRDWKTTKIFYGGKRRVIRHKEVADVHWQRGAGKRPLRLIVIAPTPYRKNQSKRLYYRDPAYLLTSDLHSPVQQLLQIYFDRWQIEVNHREEKDTLGVGQAQLWNVTSVPKRCPNSPSWPWPPIARCCWLPFGPLALSAAKPMPNFPSGEGPPGTRLVWIWSRFSAKRWLNNRNCLNLLVSKSPNRGWFAPPPLENM